MCLGRGCRARLDALLNHVPWVRIALLPLWLRFEGKINRSVHYEGLDRATENENTLLTWMFGAIVTMHCLW